MKVRTKKYLLALISFVTVFLFQNCAKNFSPGNYSNAESTGTTCTIAAGTTWMSVVGSVSCGADISVTINSGVTTTVNDTVAPSMGTAQYSCSNGVATLVPGSNACTEPTQPCTVVAGTKWTDPSTGFSCTSGAAVTIQNGGVGSLTASSFPYLGAAKYACVVGVAAIYGSGTCTSQAATAARTSVGQGFSCAIKSDGTPECWGDNTYGELGINATSATPVLLPTLVTTTQKFTKIASGGYTACGLNAAGGVYCWGNNTDGQAGQPTTTTNVLLPTAVSVPASIDVKVGFHYACALTTAGTVYCWGANGADQLGVAAASLSLSSTPRLIPGLTGVVSIDLSKMIPNAGNFGRVCAVNTAGAVYCWGFDPLENNAQNYTPTPTLVSSVAAYHFISVTVQFDSSCGLTTTGTVVCWGYNAYSQDGVAASNSNLGPTVLALSGVTEISSGTDQTCAVYTAGKIACWGLNHYYDYLNTVLLTGQLGQNPSTVEFVSTPTDLTGVTGAFHVSVGSMQTCFTQANNVVECLGYNMTGELGNKTTTTSSTPVAALLK